MLCHFYPLFGLTVNGNAIDVPTQPLSSIYASRLRKRNGLVKIASTVDTEANKVLHTKYEKAKMKKTQYCMALLALVLSTAVGACGGSKSDTGTSELNASDLEVTVSCGDWTSSLSGNGESECTTTVKNNSSASGTIYIIWDWMVGNRRCGSGFSTKADGQPGYLNVAANETGYQTAILNSLCAPLIGDPVPSNIKVSVIE